MYSGNRSGGQGHWEGGGAADAEGPGAAGTLSPAPLFSPGTYERLAPLLGCIGLLGAGNNLLVLVLYSKFPRLRTPTHLLLVNVSLSDLLVSVFGVTFTFVSCLRNGWVWDTVGCVWDGFSSSLFGESGREETGAPLRELRSRPAAVSVRPGPPSPPSGPLLPPALPLGARPGLAASRPPRAAWPSFLSFASSRSAAASAPSLRPLLAGPAAGPKPQPLPDPSVRCPVPFTSVFTPYDSAGRETAALHSEEGIGGL